MLVSFLFLQIRIFLQYLGEFPHSEITFLGVKPSSLKLDLIPPCHSVDGKNPA